MKKLLALFVCLLFSVGIVSGCGKTNDSDASAHYGEAAEIKIAVLGSKEQFETRKEFLVGMDLAIDELKKDGVAISYDLKDDGGSSDTGVGLAKDIVKDDEYGLAFTLQDADTVDSVAAIFNKAKKPLLIVDKVYNDTMEKGYDYVLAGTVSAEDAGQALADYCKEEEIEWIATAHSDTKYEKALAREFNNAVSASAQTNLLDTVTGPFNISDANSINMRWNILGVQAALVSFKDTDWACEFISELKKVNPNVLILSDADLSDLELIKEYKDALVGSILIGTNKVNVEKNLQEFYGKYEKKVMDEQGVDITSVTGMAYDFVHMIAQNVKKSHDVDEFMSNMKSSEEYEGVTGIKFDAYGYLDELPAYWVIREDQVYRIKE